jgi:hypothetical protein
MAACSLRGVWTARSSCGVLVVLFSFGTGGGNTDLNGDGVVDLNRKNMRKVNSDAEKME